MTRSASLEDRLAAAPFVLPAVLALGAVALYPILSALFLSLHRIILVFREERFVGLNNYAFLLRDARFHSALLNTAYFTAVSVALELALGLALALLLDLGFRGRGAVRAAVLVPWAIPTVVSAKMWGGSSTPSTGSSRAFCPGRT